MTEPVFTGGGGFIGRHIVDALLKENIDVTVLDDFSTESPQNQGYVRNRIKLVEVDIRTCGDWISYFANPDWVLHLSALSDYSVFSIRKNNFAQI